MIEKTKRERVYGFLKRRDGRLINGRGEEILLTGWGLGNWLLPEGYMWCVYEQRFDRPWRMEQVIRELTGASYAEKFWFRFRDAYITAEDIHYLADLGYNSVRIPFNWKLFLEEEPGIHWKEEGFRRLDDCIRWCEQEGLYAFLDMHAAPGGQTGSNIDDSYDNVPRLFIDRDNQEKALAIWERLAQRYCSHEFVGGYDLLNEPIIPSSVSEVNYDDLLPDLVRFYERCVEVIRRADANHLISIEGHHWAVKTDVFDRLYDENMVMHIHRYAEPPESACLKEYMQAAGKWKLPVWIGETGENVNEWYSALYPLALSLHMGYNLWPWKKMDCTNSPCSIRRPEGWEEITAYIKGGKHPGFQRAQEIFDEYLANVQLKNCELHPEVTDAVFRKNRFVLRASDFDEVDENGKKAYRSISKQRQRNDINYRRQTGFELCEIHKEEDARFTFDCKWDRFGLVLQEGEWVNYSVFYVAEERNFVFSYQCTEKAEIEIRQSRKLIFKGILEKTSEFRVSQPMQLNPCEEGKITFLVQRGILVLEKLFFS